ncbi:DUF2145 domain-containing protein [Endozoicomonas sp. G2_1]|uniref:DUF2145 domain-containing protein n=1 Tax=Endozoicomonas sp. G2_1 TaxID=2821091 RepID=UPI001AD9650F|nr:DUF2145 domain-containing protein [Endozoicomonas sp. G2_1]MBO9489200.1 DUF2145 domain-containing protein [Endozoicomonas sp. G2_1]
MNQLIVLVYTLLFVCTSYAGSNRATEANFSPQEIASFAKQVEKYAAQQGARAFIIARLGQPQEKLPKGIEFTHTAIAVYSEITLSNGKTAKGYAIHNLYQNADNSAKSSLVTDYPVDFFWGVSELKAGIIIPSAELQQRIIEVIASGQNQQLHNPRYSLIANPYNNRYQNCTEHTLNIVNAAIYQTTDMSRLKANTKAYFSPQPIHFSRLKLSLGSMFNSGITMKDHQGKIKTTSFTTIANYLADYDLMQEKHTFEL